MVGSYLYACPKVGHARNRSRTAYFNGRFLKQAILSSKRLAGEPVDRQGLVRGQGTSWCNQRLCDVWQEHEARPSRSRAAGKFRTAISMLQALRRLKLSKGRTDCW